MSRAPIQALAPAVAVAAGLAAFAAAAAPADWPRDGRHLLEPAPSLDQRAGEAPLDLACLATVDCPSAPTDVDISPAPAAEPSAIPLPAALTLLGAGMATLAMLIRRRADAG